MDRPLASVIRHGDSLDRVRSFSAAAREDVGYQLHLVQQGQNPRDWRAMPTVGPGAIEIRVHAENEHRIFYVARSRNQVHVLHAFIKKTQQTRKSDLEIARRRFQEMGRQK